MKFIYGYKVAVIGGLLVTGTGCETLSGQRRQTAHTEMRSEQVESNVFRLEQEVAAFAVRQEQLARAIEQLRGQNDALKSAVAADVQRIDGGLRKLEAARVQDREEIVRVLSERVSAAVSVAEARQTQASTPRTERGYEHTVKAGETLSEIAAAYSATVKSIVDSNKIDNPDRLRIGQKIFIPAP